MKNNFIYFLLLPIFMVTLDRQQIFASKVLGAQDSNAVVNDSDANKMFYLRLSLGAPKRYP